MKNIRFGASIIAAMLATVLLTACPDNKSAETPAAAPAQTSAPAATTETSAPAAAPAQESAPAEASTPAPAASTASLPAECEAYINTVDACVTKMGAAGGAMKQSLDTVKAQWAAIPDKAALSSACKSASDAFATTAKAMGC